MSESFRQVEHGRTIAFGPDALEGSGDLLGEAFTLLSTARALRCAPIVGERAATVVEVPGGLIEDVAATLRPRVEGDRLVAFGGGRVIDVAKALAAADPPRTVVAIPTSLSGAEMTGMHRLGHGVSPDVARVRPAVVINDPGLSASQPVDQLAASSANALGHALVAATSERRTPISAAVASSAVQRLACSWSKQRAAGESAADPDREQLALGALLAGWAVDVSGLGPHHALAQSAVRAAGYSHSRANAAIAPESIRSARRRRPAELEAIDKLIDARLEILAGRLRRISQGQDPDPRREDGPDPGTDDPALLDRVIEAAVARPELDRIPPAPDRDEIGEMLVAAGIGRPVPTDGDAD